MVKINVEDAPITSAHYGIMGLPTLLILKNGDLVETLLGSRSKEAIAAKVAPHL